MCIVIDTNTLTKVFKHSDAKHADFQPVFDWIINGNGKMVIGGSTYRNENFERMKWFAPLLINMRYVGKVVEIPDDTVDKEESRIKSLNLHHDFDDPHIVALLTTSRCKLICTTDKRAFPYLQNRNLYPRRTKIPAIYQNSKNSNLLCDAYVARCCRPLIKSRKDEIATMIAATEKFEK